MKLNYNNQSQAEIAEIPTIKQLERAVSQAFLALYRSKIGHSPGQVTCMIFKNYLVIVIEEALTPLEVTMIEQDQTELLAEVRQEIHEVFKPHLKQLIEKIADKEVIDLICKLNIDSSRLIEIAVMDEAPIVRRKYR